MARLRMEMIAMLHKATFQFMQDVTKVYLFISILFLNHNRLVSQGCCKIISKSCLINSQSKTYLIYFSSLHLIYLVCCSIQAAFGDFAPYLIATEASLEAVNTELSSPVTMERFRPNVVVEGMKAFDEVSMSIHSVISHKN